MVPLLLASWCLSKTDEPVISPETCSLSAVQTEVGTQEDSATDIALPPRSPAQCASSAYHGPARSRPRLSAASMVGSTDACSTAPSRMRLITRNSNEQIYMSFSKVFNLKAVYGCTFLYTCSSIHLHLNYGADRCAPGSRE